MPSAAKWFAAVAAAVATMGFSVTGQCIPGSPFAFDNVDSTCAGAACAADICCFGNLGSLGPDSGPANQMRYENIGAGIDLVVINTTPFVGSQRKNGLKLDGSLELGQIAQDTGTVDYTFSFVEAGTDTPVAPFQFSFFFLDLDSHFEGGTEAVTVFGFDECFLAGSATAPLQDVGNDQAASYGVCTGNGNDSEGRTEVNAVSVAGGATFTSTIVNGGGNNPSSGQTLTDEMKRVAVGVSFNSASSFNIRYANTAAGTLRNMLFSAKSNLISECPTAPPTAAPTSDPTSAPSATPSAVPSSSIPTAAPSEVPTTSNPSAAPTTSDPTSSPTVSPTSSSPSTSPTTSPTTSNPTVSPTASPTTSSPTAAPSLSPSTANPTAAPTASPSSSTPTALPTSVPSSSSPSAAPTAEPTTSLPSEAPTAVPSSSTPTSDPTFVPTSSSPSAAPSESPITSQPTSAPSPAPSAAPATSEPTAGPVTAGPSLFPSPGPTRSPFFIPTIRPTDEPTPQPSSAPVPAPTRSPIEFVDPVGQPGSGSGSGSDSPSSPVTVLSPISGGSGYQVGDTGLFTGGSGSGAMYLITGVDGSGSITSYIITNEGSGYNPDDILTFEGDGDGSATGTLTPPEDRVDVTSGGKGKGKGKKDKKEKKGKNEKGGKKSKKDKKGKKGSLMSLDTASEGSHSGSAIIVASVVALTVGALLVAIHRNSTSAAHTRGVFRDFTAPISSPERESYVQLLDDDDHPSETASLLDSAPVYA